MAEYRINAALPFPLRLAGGPFEVPAVSGAVKLTFATERQLTDRRIPGGEFDFLIDRFGWKAYSRVSAVVHAEASEEAVGAFCACLNNVIDHLRDLAHLHWIRNVEVQDLVELEVADEQGKTQRTVAGRARAITPPILGIGDAAEAVLKQRLADRASLTRWRSLHLEAQDALDTGRYDLAAVLGWSTLETAMCTALPKLARSAGHTADRLAEHLHNKRRRPFSLEQATEEAPVMNCILMSLRLAQRGYDPGSLMMSVNMAYRLRNRVVHEGVAVDHWSAAEALEAVDFVLRQANLPASETPVPVDTWAWEQHFSRVSDKLVPALGATTGRLVPYHSRDKDPIDGTFRLTAYGDLYQVFMRPDIREEHAAALVAIHADMYRMRLGYPHLQASAVPFLIPGLLRMEASSVSDSVYLAFAAGRRQVEGFEVSAACEYMLEKIGQGLTDLTHTLAPQDVRSLVIASRVVAYAARVSPQYRGTFEQHLRQKQPTVADLASKLVQVLNTTLTEDPHSICHVLRRIHQQTDWMDSIRVVCPIENMTYGSGRRGRDIGAAAPAANV